VKLNGPPEARACGDLNVAFAGCDGEMLLLSLRDLAVSTGSACNSASIAPSYVLKAIGLDDDLAHASIRFSLGRYTTAEEVSFAIQHIRQVVKHLQKH
ncbi:MAG TPA: aminotransferase class V-fold PLP-dependent enzyme, partial [Cellvibrio sp.]|nr:aminotransferase class V-fold PLP-dependent enzyme [Cellvibrio sp.]